MSAQVDEWTDPEGMRIREHPTHARRSWYGLIPVVIVATLMLFLSEAGCVVALIGSAEAMFSSLVLGAGAVVFGMIWGWIRYFSCVCPTCATRLKRTAADRRHSYYRCLRCAVVWRSSFVVLSKYGTPQ
jgi:hypothetical protein